MVTFWVTFGVVSFFLIFFLSQRIKSFFPIILLLVLLLVFTYFKIPEKYWNPYHDEVIEWVKVSSPTLYEQIQEANKDVKRLENRIKKIRKFEKKYPDQQATLSQEIHKIEQSLATQKEKKEAIEYALRAAYVTKHSNEEKLLLEQAQEALEELKDSLKKLVK